MNSLTAQELIELIDRSNNRETVELDGISYSMAKGDHFMFNRAIKLYPHQHNIQSITVPLNYHQDYIGNEDLDARIHEGFTVGRGKVMYFLMIWHSSGACTVYPTEQYINSPRYLRGDEMITIHFKL